MIWSRVKLWANAAMEMKIEQEKNILSDFKFAPGQEFAGNVA